MTDEQNPPMANTPESRTPTGEIKDQSNLQPQDQSLAGATGAAEPSPAGATGVAGPPEKYEFKPPEGVTYDQKLLDEATPIFKELKLDQASAQRLVDFYSKSTGGSQKDLVKAVETMRTDWREQVSRDPVVGSKISEAQVEIGRAKDLLPSDVREAFNKAMDFTGAGDHPAVFRAMYELAKLVNEGKHVAGGGPSPHGQAPGGKVATPSGAKALYPNLP